MTSVSNVAVGALMAGAAASKARHGMNEAIARLSTGVRAMYGGDAGGTSQAFQFRAEGKSAAIAARASEDGISILQAAESALLEIAAINIRLRELAVQKTSGLLQTAETAAIKAEEDALAAAGVAIDGYSLNGVGLLGAAVKITTDLDGGTTALGSTGTIVTQLTRAKADTQMAIIQKDLGNIAAGLASLKARQAALSSLSANGQAMAARIADTDFAVSSANLAKFSILNQSSMAMVAQANQAQAAVLAVLQ